MKEFAIQQYTFRPWAQKDGLFPVLEQISAMGYTGLEMCCFGGFEALKMSAAELKTRLEDLGMHLIGNHFTRDSFLGNHDEAFAYIAEAGGSYAIYNIWGSYDREADVQEKADYLNALSAVAQKQGITLLYHNHAEEFARLNGKLVIEHLMEALDPQICFEHDIYFSSLKGCNVYDYLRTHNRRIRTVHLKQIDAEGENVDLEDGVLDISEVIYCASSATDYILEQSSFSKSIPHSLQRNADYLKKLYPQLGLTKSK